MSNDSNSCPPLSFNIKISATECFLLFVNFRQQHYPWPCRWQWRRASKWWHCCYCCRTRVGSWGLGFLAAVQKFREEGCGCSLMTGKSPFCKVKTISWLLLILLSLLCFCVCSFSTVKLCTVTDREGIMLHRYWDGWAGDSTFRKWRTLPYWAGPCHTTELWLPPNTEDCIPHPATHMSVCRCQVLLQGNFNRYIMQSHVQLQKSQV